jgi:non-canonical (house-cleaning) NTP pyrophosphatase
MFYIRNNYLLKFFLVLILFCYANIELIQAQTNEIEEPEVNCLAPAVNINQILVDRFQALPSKIIVTSTNKIKNDSVIKTIEKIKNSLGIKDSQDKEIIGKKAASDISEQPVGKETVLGAINRIEDVKRIVKNSGKSIADYCFISIENGIFQCTTDGKLIEGDINGTDINQTSIGEIKKEELKPITEEDINKEDVIWKDYAIVVIEIPKFGIKIKKISPKGVEFPKQAILDTLYRGGFGQYTVGSTIALNVSTYKKDAQEKHKGNVSKDPHSLLTDGEITRQDQLLEVIEQAIQEVLVTQYSS